MADQDIFHTAELVKAAIPFVDNRTQGMADLFVKVCDLMGSVKSARKPQNLAACGLALESIDIEGLLAAVRPVCNKQERDIVDRILNLFHMKKMFEMYTSMMETMKNMQDVGGFPFGDMNSENASNIFSNFSGSNFESIFQTVKAFTQSTDSSDTNTAFHESASDTINSENVKDVYAAEMNNYANGENVYHPETTDNYGSPKDYGYTEASGYANGSDSIQDNGNDRKEYSTANDAVRPQTDQTVEEILRDIKSAAAADSFSNYNMGLGSGFGSASTFGSGSGSGSSSGSGSNSASSSGSESAGSSSGSGSGSASGSGSVLGSGSNTNSAQGSSSASSPTPMLDMLKTMVPSDKMNTFENLSMLFNSMSYDNNSKSDDQKGE